MAKKSKAKQSTGNLFTLIALLLSIASLIMLFLPAINVINSETTFKGSQVVFGYEEVTKVLGSTITTSILDFSFMNLLTYILVVVGTVLLIVNILGKGNDLTDLISIVALLVAGILFFLTVNFTMPYLDELASKITTIEEVRENYELGIGAILGGIFSILAAVSLVLKKVVK